MCVQASVCLSPGQSTIAFIYDFVETFEGPHPGYALISGRPQAGKTLQHHLNHHHYHIKQLICQSSFYYGDVVATYST
jgi:hypothetical protein